MKSTAGRPAGKPASSSAASAPPLTPKPAVAGVAHAATPGAGAGAPAAKGRDVAAARVTGLEFPYPGYLDNLVRQVRVRFAPSQTRGGLHADLAFVIARDGSVSGLRVVRGSGNYSFDLEAQGAVEAAGAAHAFGALPDAFRASALPVTFSFEPHSLP